MAAFYDTHAHLDFPEFHQDLPQIIERATAAGVTRIITIGTDLPGSRRAIELAERYSSVYAAVGCHPNHAGEAPDDIRSELLAIGKHPRVVAIGETGLDYHRLASPDPAAGNPEPEMIKARQAALFKQQLEVASQLGLNCIIHQRQAYADTMALFAPYADRVRGVFHCFAGTPAEVAEIMALGSLVSYTGILTFKNGANIREALSATPRDRFMLETDCPYLAPVPYRGKRCEPAYVAETAKVAAEVTEMSLEDLSRATCDSAHRFFPKLLGGG